jgi:hypothetical protein
VRFIFAASAGPRRCVKLLKRTRGRKVWRVELPAFAVPPSDKPGGWYSVEPPDSDIYDQARKLLAAAPHDWPNGASPEDVIETCCYRRGLPQGTLSMYGIIGECRQWKVQENKHGNPSLPLVRWRRMTDGERARLVSRRPAKAARACGTAPQPGFGGIDAR